MYQQLTLITKSIKDGEMFKNPVLVKNMKAAIDEMCIRDSASSTPCTPSRRAA